MLDRDLIDRFRVPPGKKLDLGDYDPSWAQTKELKRLGKDAVKTRAQEVLQENLAHLAEAQELLYANDAYSVLVCLQAMDAAGKDGTIKHVMTGVNPQGVQVFAFKTPSAEELDHNFLWRYMKALPERGRIGIFNRSYYEEVLVVRVHPEILAKEKMPDKLVTKDIWKERFKDIRAFERYLARNGTLILKFFLHVSKDEQKRRFLERIEEPSKNWKFAMGDVEERKLWDKYMDAYEDMIRHTSRPEAPWHVVPADNKWFTRLVVAAEVVDALDRLGLKYPKVAGAARGDLEKARQILRKER